MKRRRKYKDRLSDLPDGVILHILSFLNAKCAVQTCILSKRWNNLWKHLPTLILSSSHFMSFKNFNKFVSRILSLRNASTPLRALDFEHHHIVEPYLLRRIIKYAVSHHVQELSIGIICDIQHFPTCFFSCRTLTSLTLVLDHPIEEILFPSSLNLPALATLSLEGFIFRVGDDGYAEPFSAFSSLNSLTIRYCRVLDAPNLWISSAILANLTLKSYHHQYDKIELSTPSLCTFVFGCTGDIPDLRLRGRESNLSSVKHVNIDLCVECINEDTPLVLLKWQVELANIKSLTINETALEVLSLVPDLSKVEFHSLCNLKLLKVKMCIPSSIPNGTFYFLLQNSPSAKVEVIDLLRFSMVKELIFHVLEQAGQFRRGRICRCFESNLTSSKLRSHYALVFMFKHSWGKILEALVDVFE